MTGERAFRVELQAGPEAAAMARSWFDGLAEMYALRVVAFDARLLLTELVSSSERHAETDAIELTLMLNADAARVDVRNCGSGFPADDVATSPTCEGGRGLMIVAALASSWGVGPGAPFTVWFELSLDRATHESVITIADTSDVLLLDAPGTDRQNEGGEGAASAAGLRSTPHCAPKRLRIAGFGGMVGAR
jgi:hypothetical protein